ncbi:MAG TPA: response regulator [Candidatus Polarisedimenticolaceae bacterium]|nr:response regulator [Candidatus Polarisedimenticolaceae bacterium]
MIDARIEAEDRVNILLVDDQPAKLLSYEAILGGLGENLLKAQSAAEALDQLLRRDVAVMLVDVCMPELDGFELAAMIRQHPRCQKTAIILVSAVLMSDLDRLKGYGSGAMDYLPVPVVPEILRAKVSIFVDLYRKSRQLERVNQELELRVRERTTALAESEERFRVALRHSRIAVLHQDGELRYTWAYNPQFGLTADEMLGRRDVDVFGPETARHLTALKRAVLDSGRGAREEIWLSREGARFCYDLSVEPLHDEVGQRSGVTCVAVDITERNRLEAALREGDRRKDEFLATLAHELRNPLAAISNAAQTVRLKARDNTQDQGDQEIIQRQVAHLSRLVDDLLDIGRIAQDRLELRREPVDLVAVIHGAVTGSRAMMERKGHHVAVDLPFERLMLDVDAVRLAQVFQNLLDNAAKYTESDGRIVLGAKCEGDEVAITVRDSGIGIAREHLPHVFETFYQVDRSLERAHGGLGIGLSLVKRIVELHGGGVEAHSAGAGKGSEFVVRLPVPLGSRPASPPPEAAPAETREGAPRRILVVDDNRDSADSLAMVLRLMGHAVETAYDGMSALQVAARSRPHVVLLDLGMPEMNGYDTCRQIRAQAWGRGMVVIAQTGWGQDQDRSRTEEAGFDGHLTKPADLELLAKMLDELPARAGRKAPRSRVPSTDARG